MNSLIHDRKLGIISPLEFSKTLIESTYISLHPHNTNYHSNGSINCLSLENHEFKYLLSGSADLSIKLWESSETSDEFLTNLDSGFDFSGEEPISSLKSTAKNQGLRLLGTIPRKTGHDFGVSYVQWWPVDTGMFISSSFDHTVKIWDTNEFSIIKEFNLNNRVYSFDIKNNLIAIASDQPFIRLLDINSTSTAQTIKGHKGKTITVKWHPKDENILASGGFDGEIKIWDIRRSNNCLCRLDMLNTSNYYNEDLTKESIKAHSAPVNGLVWDKLGHTLFSTGNDDKIKVWDMLSNYPPKNKLINFGPLTRNKFLQNLPLTLNYNYENDLQYIIFPSDNGDLFFFRTVDGKLVKRIRQDSGRIVSLAMDRPFSNEFYCGTINGDILGFKSY